MKELTLSWAIYTMPAVKAAVADPIKRETGQDICHRMQGLCGGLHCYQCPLLHNDVCYASRMSRDMEPRGTPDKRRDMLYILVRGNTL